MLWMLACSSRKKSTINSWLSLMKSSVKPLDRRSWPKCSRHRGSKASSSANSEGGRPLLMLMDEDMGEKLGGGGGRFDREASAGVGADECRWPKRPPSRPCF